MRAQSQPPCARATIGPTGSLVLEGRLDAEGTAAIWAEAEHLVQVARPTVVDAQAVDYCDSAGIVLLIHLQIKAREQGNKAEIHGLPPQFQALFASQPSTHYQDRPPQRPMVSFPEFVGRKVMDFLDDLKALITFVGELSVTLMFIALRPNRVRWKTFWEVLESTGVNALPIIGLIGFLTGCILAFQSAVPLRQFGVDIFAVNLTALALLRELGPIMTAILLAGRSGSAFAAEIGTMKVNQEIDALKTMGIAPLRFLVGPRVLAAVVATPLLSIYANAIGIAGSILIMMAMGFPFSALINQLMGAVTIKDILSGVVKSFFFGILISSIGCLRGLQTGAGAVAVGQSTTRAVVSGIVLIVAADALFAALFYALKF